MNAKTLTILSVILVALAGTYFLLGDGGAESFFRPKVQIKRGKRVFPYWRIQYEHLRSVHSSSLAFRDRMRCYGHVARWTRYFASELWKDLAYMFQRSS